MKKAKKLKKLLESNTFLVNTSICVVVLLLMFYFGISSSVRKTYSATVNGSCGVGYVLGEDTSSGTYQYCCPTGTHYVKPTKNSDGYCVNDNYQFGYYGGKLNCAASAGDRYFTRAPKNIDKICTETLAFSDDWKVLEATATFCAFGLCDYNDVVCGTEALSTCTTAPEVPSYSGGACFVKKYGNGYEWITNPSLGQKLALLYTTEASCTKAHQDYVDSKMTCFVNDKTGNYMWESEIGSEWLVSDQGYKINTSFTNERSCLSNNTSDINYQAGTGVTNMPSNGVKKYYETTFISTTIPVHEDGLEFLYWEDRGTKYYPGDPYELEMNLYLHPVFKEDWLNQIKNYVRLKDELIINKVPVNTTFDDFKNNVTLNSGFDWDADFNDYKTINGKNVLYTGSTFTILKEDDVYDVYVAIVTGDANSDGKISLTDYVDIYNHIDTTSTDDKLGEYGKYAADYNGDGSIKLTDYVDIYNYVLNNN